MWAGGWGGEAGYRTASVPFTLVRALEKILAWWSTQSGGALNGASITRLVQSCEQILTAERLAWSNIGDESKEGAGGGGGGAEGGGAKGGRQAQGGGGASGGTADLSA